MSCPSYDIHLQKKLWNFVDNLMKAIQAEEDFVALKKTFKGLSGLVLILEKSI